MNNNDFNFEQFIKLLDGALASDDKNVKQALRKFLFVAAMVMGDDAEPGPFTQMMETIDSLQQRISTLESQGSYTFSGSTTWPNTTTTTTATGTSWPLVAGSTTAGSITAATTAGGYTSGYARTSPSSSFTTKNIFATYDDEGTKIKEEIKEGLEKLAKSA